MKLILPTLTLVSFISADRNSRIQNLLTTLKSQLENTPVNSNDENAPFPMMGNQMGRKINSNDVQIINGYGCWCNFDNQKNGKGVPVDEYDTICKTLFDNYHCIEMDQEAENDVCDLENQEYTSALGSGQFDITISSERLIYECQVANPNNNCGMRLCIAEGNFVIGMLKLPFQQLIFPDSFSFGHGNGFDVNSCSFGGIAVESEVSCCGQLPKRFPYRTLDGGRACCNGRTYNTITATCCQDGTVSKGSSCF